ncbi:MAG: UDP-glucose/GDP-mannose dehydrogenase family protein, partial [Deinococcus sp.]|nr:UDP-glucose/GDP-mannose dehydrogenase family protein [Deinococcus sp.]
MTIVGTGYVGLTTGAVLAYLGNQVTCVDIDQDKISALRAGCLPLCEPGLPELIRAARGALEFTTSLPPAVRSAELIFIAVGTPPGPGGEADLSAVRAAAQGIGEQLNGNYQVIVTKSTVPVGCGNWVEMLVRDHYAHCNGGDPPNASVTSNPEFLREGSAIHDSLYPDRIVVGCDDPRALQLVQRLYEPILGQSFSPPEVAPRPVNYAPPLLVTTDLTSAEAIKYAANAFLALKISFINEIAGLCEKVG